LNCYIIYTKCQRTLFPSVLSHCWLATACLCFISVSVLKIILIHLQFQLDGCIVWNAHNTVFSSKHSAICAQAVYFLHSTMHSVTCLQLSDVSIICHVTYLQLTFQSAFLPRRSAKWHSGILGLPNIRHWTLPKIWEVSFTKHVGQGNDSRVGK